MAVARISSRGGGQKKINNMSCNLSLHCQKKYSGICSLYLKQSSINYIKLENGQPVALVVEYLLVQVSSISCNVGGSILELHAWKTLTHQL